MMVRVLRLVEWLRDSRGTAAVEFGFIAPVAVVLLIGVVDLGLVANTMMQLRAAARAGAQYAVENPTDTDGIEQAVLNSGALPSGGVTVTPAVTCECKNGTAITCGSPCADGNPQRVLVSVAVTRNFVPLIPFTGFGVEAPVSGSATFRVQ
jgi:Flp pilus assembly protein TadG